MIEFRPLSFDSLLNMTDVLNELEIQAFDYSDASYDKMHAFVVLDGGKKVGLSLFTFIDSDMALMKLIYIDPALRGLKFGDGLLRASLNSIEIHGGKAVIFEGGAEELSFYLHEGMTSYSDISDEEMKRVTEAYEPLKGRLYAYCRSIAAFFDKPCKGHAKH